MRPRRGAPPRASRRRRPPRGSARARSRGGPLAAQEALGAGWVARIVNDLDAAKAEVAAAIVKAPPLAMRLGKRAIDRGIEPDPKGAREGEIRASEEQVDFRSACAFRIELDPKGAREAEIQAIEEQLASGQWMGKTQEKG